jgi:uncharacterized membrane protein YqjE
MAGASISLVAAVTIVALLVLVSPAFWPSQQLKM